MVHISVCACVWVGVGVVARCGSVLRACSFTYPAHNALEPSYLLPLWLLHIFRLYLINGTISGKRLLNMKCVFWFSLQLLIETFLILRKIQRDIVIECGKFLCKLPVILLEF